MKQTECRSVCVLGGGGGMVRFKYQLARKQCNAILKTMASMVMVKANYKKGNDNIIACRFCRMEPETQVHILQECQEVRKTLGKCNYESIFKDDAKLLKENIELPSSKQRTNSKSLSRKLPSMCSSHRSEPPGRPGHMQHNNNIHVSTDPKIRMTKVHTNQSDPI